MPQDVDPFELLLQILRLSRVNADPSIRIRQTGFGEYTISIYNGGQLTREFPNESVAQCIWDALREYSPDLVEKLDRTETKSS